MTELINGLFDLAFYPFTYVDTPFILFPAGCLLLLFAFWLLKKMMGRSER